MPIQGFPIPNAPFEESRPFRYGGEGIGFLGKQAP